MLSASLTGATPSAMEGEMEVAFAQGGQRTMNSLLNEKVQIEK